MPKSVADAEILNTFSNKYFHVDSYHYIAISMYLQISLNSGF